MNIIDKFRLGCGWYIGSRYERRWWVSRRILIVGLENINEIIINCRFNFKYFNNFDVCMINLSKIIF